VNADILICDFAEALNGKLYILGGGWSQHLGPADVSCTLAVRLSVPWNQANQKHSLAIVLRSEDEVPVVGPEGNPVALSGDFEIGRPPGLVPGEDLTNTFAYRVENLPLADGGYSFVVEVDGSEIARASFRKRASLG
jgi:hypothetical protein